MGADRAMHVEYGQEDYSDLGPLAVANMLAKIIQKEDVNLVILGKQVWLGWGGRERERRGGGVEGEKERERDVQCLVTCICVWS